MISIECLKRETRSLSQYLPATGEATREQRHGLGHGDLVTFFFLLIFIFPYPICIMYVYFLETFHYKTFFFSLFLFIKSDNIINHRIGKGKKFYKKKKVQVHKNYSIYIYLHFVNYLIIRNIPKKKN